MEEIANRKSKNGLNVVHETDIGMRLNENKRLIHDILQGCKLSLGLNVFMFLELIKCLFRKERTNR